MYTYENGACSRETGKKTRVPLTKTDLRSRHSVFSHLCCVEQRADPLKRPGYPQECRT
jgi:hypothetical protein